MRNAVRHPIVTIDGPAGAGKSTTSRALAARLGYVFLDTGAIYRAVALALRDRAPDLATVLVGAESAAALGEDRQAAMGALVRQLRIHFSDGGSGVWLDDCDVSAQIRTPEISDLASKVSAVGPVREALLELQRSVGRPGGVVAEGRDMGTVVFPDAEVKLFLTASVAERARRRVEELRAKGVSANEAETRAAIEERDARDSGRAVAPLRCPDDATVIDSTGLSAEAVVERMLAAVNARQVS